MRGEEKSRKNGSLGFSLGKPFAHDLHFFHGVPLEFLLTQVDEAFVPSITYPRQAAFVLSRQLFHIHIHLSIGAAGCARRTQNHELFIEADFQSEVSMPQIHQTLHISIIVVPITFAHQHIARQITDLDVEKTLGLLASLAGQPHPHTGLESVVPAVFRHCVGLRILRLRNPLLNLGLPDEDPRTKKKRKKEEKKKNSPESDD